MLAAYQALQDCERAVQLLEDDVEEDLFRIHYVAALALVRAVGHVLDKVDGSKNNARLRQAIDAAYIAWKTNQQQHRIFWEFIEEERNNVLKEYRFGFIPGDIPIVAGSDLHVLNENLYRPMEGGSYGGEDARDILLEAIAWWHEQLRNIERSAV